MKQNNSERAAALAVQIEIHSDGTVTLPKPVWKGRTLEQELAAFNEHHAINEALHGADDHALGYPVNVR